MTYYFILACLWGIYNGYKQSQKTSHNSSEWILLCFLINTIFMPISVLVYAYRKWILEAKDLQS